MNYSSVMHPVIAEDLSSVLSQPLPWERLRGKTILVTGGGGFLPAYLIETLLLLNQASGLGCHVICLARSLTKVRARFAGYSDRKDLSYVLGDVSVGIPVQQRCDFIIHAASPASPKHFGPDPVGTMAANLLGTFHLLNLAREWHSEGFLFFSSGEVYGQVPPEKVPIRESDYGYIDILNPRSCYAEGKRAAETLVVSYFQQFRVPGIIVRPFHTYGPGMDLNDGRVFADFVNDIVHRRNLTLHSDGKAVRAFCYLGDAVGGFFTALLRGECGQAYNIGNPDAASNIGDLADLLIKLFPDLGLTVNRQGTATPGYLPSPISFNSPNIDRITQLGWRPHHSIQSGFSRTIRYFSESIAP